MNWSDLLKAVIPIIVASLAWLLGQVNDFSTRLTRIEGAMPALITKEGVPTDSPNICGKKSKPKRSTDVAHQ